MMEARLCVTSCDKWGDPMKQGDNILIVAEGVNIDG